MTDTLLDLAIHAIAHARRLGASAAEAICVDGRGTDIDVREGRIENLEQAESREIGIRVFSGQSSASISGSVLTPAAIADLVEKAHAMAKLAPPDPFAGIAQPEQLAARIPDLDLVSERLPDSAELERMAREAEEAALAVAGVSKSGGAGAAASDFSMAVAISNGFAQSMRRTGVSLSVSAIAGEGTAMERDYDFTSAVHFSDLRRPEDVGREAGQRAARRRDPRKLKSQAVPVFFDRRVATSLIGHLLGAINGAAIARGTSFLKESLGQQVFARGVTISDDPLRRRGPASRPYDAEGLAVSCRDLIADGVLTGWLLDLRSARQLGLAPTGQAGGGLGGPPSPTASNVHMVAGSANPQALMASVPRGLLVTEFMGSSVNMVTGDYSRGASGFWIENGIAAYPVSEITIAGNLKDMFLNVTPANDLEFRTSVNAPTCLVEGLTIAGL